MSFILKSSVASICSHAFPSLLQFALALWVNIICHDSSKNHFCVDWQFLQQIITVPSSLEKAFEITQHLRTAIHHHVTRPVWKVAFIKFLFAWQVGANRELMFFSLFATDDSLR